MKKLPVLLGTLLAVSSFGYPASASNANPPIVASVIALTAGPYKPGDMIQFQVKVTGGEPGIKKISLQSPCIRSSAPYGSQVIWDEKTQEIPGFITQEIFTSTITGTCTSGMQPLTVIVTDKTQLNAYYNNPAAFEVKGAYQLPIGEVPPVISPDELDLSYIPALEYDPKKKQEFKLPNATTKGVPIYWIVSPAAKACTVDRRFPGDTGGSLRILGRGLCILERPEVKATNNQFFEAPVVKTNWKIGSKNSRYIRGDIWIKGKPHYVLCVKGSKSFKYSQADATCLPGYKEKL